MSDHTRLAAPCEDATTAGIVMSLARGGLAGAACDNAGGGILKKRKAALDTSDRKAENGIDPEAESGLHRARGHVCVGKTESGEHRSAGPEGRAGMKLRPREPEGLMAAKVGPIGIDRADTAGRKH